MFVEKSSQLGKRGFRSLHNFTRMCFLFCNEHLTLTLTLLHKGERGACVVKGGMHGEGGHAW